MHNISELTIDSDSSVTKIDQIIRKIKRDIEAENLKSHERLLSISEFSKQHKVAKQTVEKAYKELQRQGYIFPVSGKGSYVSTITLTKKRILMIVDKLSSYNKEIYSAFSKKLGVDVDVDLQIHHNDPVLLNEVALSSQGRYHFYVILPPSPEAMREHEFESILMTIPATKLIILNRKVSLTSFRCINIYQDFNEDILEALSSRSELFNKYHGITLVIPVTMNRFIDISDGIKQFCIKYSKNFSIDSSLEDVNLKSGEVYIILTESHLADFNRKLRRTDLKRGKDVGLLSLQDSVLSELLDVTVITSNFEAMGETAARLILEKRVSVVRNSYKLIQRRSL